MDIKYDKKLLKQTIEAQKVREGLYKYPNHILWLALIKNVGEAIDTYFRKDKHYIKELGDIMVNVLMILGEENVDIQKTLDKSMKKTIFAIKKTVEQEKKGDHSKLSY